ncbi:MAG: 16S rRNA (guanine(527)-N(7))-methyltransferase RsmG [Ruminococcaceae bacterium]|nr:16S rRNA (guanine(527)-N(7))-methyltransferase RsmG [Oscillospiraceae bacterium]
MEFNEFYEYCRAVFEANKNLPAVDKEKADKLYVLTNRMLEVNAHMNLTAIKEEKAIILRHYADSLAISEHIAPNAKVIDVGCGAGFPTLPLAIFRPDVDITALDSTAKRINYVADTAKLLELSNVTAIAERAEVLANNIEYREKFDYATARAVAALPILTELCMPFVKIGGKFVAMKAQKADSEISLSMTAITKCGGKLQERIVSPLYNPNGESEERMIIICSKVGATPKELPRHYSKISKKPL